MILSPISIFYRMTKYTINKIFERSFPANIWKIEIDPVQSLVAVETRDVDSTVASFSVFDFTGKVVKAPCTAEAKEWTLDAIQDGFLILKRIGEHRPIQEGIQIIEIATEQVVFSSYEFILLDVFEDVVHARHRSISSGETILIDIRTGKYAPASDRNFRFASNKIQYPLTYPNKPEFLSNEAIEGPLWLSKCCQHYIWCYHVRNKDNLNLILTLSDLNHKLDRQVIMENMDKLIPQPYFQIDKQLFFMSFNKRDIISYLV